MMKRFFCMTAVTVGLASGLGALAGCAVKEDVKMSGDERKMRIVAPSGYDTLGIAEKHCRSYKKKAVFAGRGEGAGSVITTHFNCMER